MKQSVGFIQMPATLLRPNNGTATNVSARRGVASRTTVSMSLKDTPPMSFADYMRQRDAGLVQGGTMSEAKKEIDEFIAGGGDMEFDGGDSGGGVVGDGNMDLEDQHNSTEMLREGFSEIRNLETQGLADDSEQEGKVQSAMSSRIASAGQNYFGRSTGYAETKIEKITEDDRKHHRMDEVRAQQLENWHNQRSIHSTRMGRQDAPMFGEKRFETDTYTAKLNQKIESSEPKVTPRRDGKEWGEINAEASEEVEQVFELKSRLDQTCTTEITVVNPYIRFMPFRCEFTPDSHYSFSVEPKTGTMSRSSAKPVNLIVRYTPRAYEDTVSGTLVFETEEFKYVYKFFGST